MLPMCIGYYWMILRYPQFRKPSAVVFHLVDVLLEKILAFPSLTQSASKSYNSWWPTSIKCCTNPKAAMFFFPVQNEVQGFKQDSNKYVPISRNTAMSNHRTFQTFPNPTTQSCHLPWNGTFRTWTCGIMAAESDRSDRWWFFRTSSGSMCQIA